MLNRFRAKMKLSAFGIMSSTGKTGLDWTENNQYGGGSDGFEYDEDNGFFFSQERVMISATVPIMAKACQKSWAAGLNYSNKFNDQKQSLNGSYRYNKLNTEGLALIFPSK